MLMRMPRRTAAWQQVNMDPCVFLVPKSLLPAPSPRPLLPVNPTPAVIQAGPSKHCFASDCMDAMVLKKIAAARVHIYGLLCLVDKTRLRLFV
jgi:hypothetical protein